MQLLKHILVLLILKSTNVLASEDLPNFSSKQHINNQVMSIEKVTDEVKFLVNVSTFFLTSLDLIK